MTKMFGRVLPDAMLDSTSKFGNQSFSRFVRTRGFYRVLNPAGVMIEGFLGV